MKPIVYVAALTYRRPGGIAELLSGLSRLEQPPEWDVRFLIVDNDPEGSARAKVEEENGTFEGRFHYLLEPEPGIPFARNSALREAIARGAILLCFIDDDETPEPNWLVELLRHWIATGAQLIGGPLRRSMPSGRLSIFQRLLARSLIARRAWAERRAARAAAAGKPVLVNTSNWMCQLSAVQEHGLWFDEQMRFSGGTDAAFCLQAREVGLRISWCPSAIVSEPITVERLSLSYQYGRSRAQGIVMARLQNKRAARVWLEQLPRAAVGLGLIFVPLLGIASLAAGLHFIASAAGHLAHLRGRQSGLYERHEVPHTAEAA